MKGTAVEYLALQIIASLPGSIRRLTADLSDEQMHRRPSETEWSVVEIVGHLIDKTEAWGERFHPIATEEQPVLPSYDQDERVRERRYQSQPLPGLTDRLNAALIGVRGQLRDLPADAWTQIGLHEERGRLTLAEAVRIYAASLPDHVEQLVATRDAALSAQADRFQGDRRRESRLRGEG